MTYLAMLFAFVFTTPHVTIDAGAMLKFSCSVMQRDCSKVTMPKFEFVSMRPGMLGGYDGGDTIYLDANKISQLPQVEAEGVVAHELTHWVDVQMGIVPVMPTKDEVCLSEDNAHRVENAYLVVHGRPDLANYEWFTYYGCHLPEESDDD